MTGLGLKVAGPQIEKDAPGAPLTCGHWGTDCLDEGEWPLLEEVYGRERFMGGLFQIGTVKLFLFLPFIFLLSLWIPWDIQ